MLREDRSPELHRDASAAPEQTLRISGGGPQDQGPPTRTRSGKTDCLAGRWVIIWQKAGPVLF